MVDPAMLLAARLEEDDGYEVEKVHTKVVSRLPDDFTPRMQAYRVRALVVMGDGLPAFSSTAAGILSFLGHDVGVDVQARRAVLWAGRRAARAREPRGAHVAAGRGRRVQRDRRLRRLHVRDRVVQLLPQVRARDAHRGPGRDVRHRGAAVVVGDEALGEDHARGAKHLTEARLQRGLRRVLRA